MPYNKKKEKIRNLQRKVQRMENKVLIEEFNKATEIIEKEIKKMYDAYIDHYYLYKTKSYIRHEETQPGTQRGINLYRGINLTTYKKYVKEVDREIEEFELVFDGRDMDDGYQYHTPYEVLTTVMSGTRGVPGIWEKKWSYQYNSEYYQSGRKKMIQEFYKFMSQTGELSYKIAMPNINKRLIPFYEEQAKELNKIIFSK